MVKYLEIFKENSDNSTLYISGMRLVEGVLIQLQLKQKNQKEAKLDGENNASC